MKGWGGISGAIKALAKDCTNEVDGQGGVRTRNPEELLEVFSLYWAVLALTGTSVRTRSPIALERIAPTLRASTFGRRAGAFSRGGRGVEVVLMRPLPHREFERRLGTPCIWAMPANEGRLSLIIDASAPPVGAAANGHASTLAFELTSGRRSLIVNCGSGKSFGVEWRRAGRATPSHSTLASKGIHQRGLRRQPASWEPYLMNSSPQRGLLSTQRSSRWQKGRAVAQRL